GVDHAQVAVHRLGGVQGVGARAGRVEGAGDLLADVGRFAGAGDGHAPGATVDQADHFQERVVQPAGDFFEGLRLGADDLAGVLKALAFGEGGGAVVELKVHRRI